MRLKVRLKVVLESIELEYIRCIVLVALQLQAETGRLLKDEADGFGVPSAERAAEVVWRLALARDWVRRIDAAGACWIEVGGKDGEGVLATGALETVSCTAVLLGLDTCARDFEKAVGAVVRRDICGDAAVAPNLVAFVAKVERVERMKSEAGCG